MIFDDDTINTAASELGPGFFISVGIAMIIVGVAVAIFSW